MEVKLWVGPGDIINYWVVCGEKTHLKLDCTISLSGSKGLNYQDIAKLIEGKCPSHSLS